MRENVAEPEREPKSIESHILITSVRIDASGKEAGGLSSSIKSKKGLLCFIRYVRLDAELQF